MYIKLFDLQGNKVIPSIHCYTISWLKILIDEYPENYLKIFSYLQYMSSWNVDDNPYLAMKEEDREETITKDLEIDFSLDDDLIQEALEKCQTMHELPSYRLWRSAKNGIDKIRDYLDSVKVTSGKDGSNADFRATLKDLPNLQKAYNDGYKDFMEESKIMIRGDKFNSMV